MESEWDGTSVSQHLHYHDWDLTTEQENAISWHHKEMEDDDMSAGFPVLSRQHAQLTQDLVLHSGWAATPECSLEGGSTPPSCWHFTGVNSARSPKGSQDCCVTETTPSNANQQLSLSLVQGERVRKEYSITIQIMKERWEMAGSKASEVPESWFLLQLTFLPSKDSLSAVWRICCGIKTVF